jgi:NAD(P)-dependent dehydrogenase (short-subunit alcohol dehydrogenase family)
MQPSERQFVGELFSVEGKIFLVTGGTRGIGYMIAEGLLRAGARVIVSGRKRAACTEAESILGVLGDVQAIPCDLSEESECSRLITEITSRVGTLDVVVNNAGVSWGAPLAEYPDGGWDRVMDLNVKGLFNVSRFARALLEKDAAPDNPSRIINISSTDGIVVPRFENYAYSASKAAVNHLTAHLAAELAPLVLVNAIAPGPFPSRMMAALGERADVFPGMTRVGRMGRLEDIAGAVIYLSSRAATYTTGAVLTVDGGLSTTGPAVT